ncbi:MAG: hypothetical protein ACFFFG_01605 [Candidatus Thorarchaeota archaeon]
MYLHKKFLIGFGILGIVGLGFTFLGSVFIPQVSIGEYYIFLGIVTIGVGVFFAYLLFAPERIKGYTAEYEAAPDLSEFRVVKTFREVEPSSAEKPEMAYCGACGRQIHKPFRCGLCGQYLCGKHYLRGDHICTDGG